MKCEKVDATQDLKTAYDSALKNKTNRQTKTATQLKVQSILQNDNKKKCIPVIYLLDHCKLAGLHAVHSIIKTQQC